MLFFSAVHENKIKKLIEHFVAGTTAQTTADLVRVHKNTANKLCTIIATKIEVDESYFGGHRKR